MTWGTFLLLFALGGVVLAGLGRFVWLAERQRQARARAASPASTARPPLPASDPGSDPDAP